jgi:hypothetical protein
MEQDKQIDVSPSRKGTTAMLILILKNGETHRARQWAEDELMRICPEEW